MSCSPHEPCTECGAGGCATTKNCREKQEAARRYDEWANRPCPHCQARMRYDRKAQAFECRACMYTEPESDPDPEQRVEET